MLIYLKSTVKYIVFSLITFSFLGSCSLFERKPELIDDYGSAFSKGQALVKAHDYQHAITFLNRALEEDTLNYKETLLLAARAYDQLGQPEQAILSIQEYLKPRKEMPIMPLKELTARSLLLKNQAKVKIDITQSEEKKIIQSLVNDKNFSKANVIDSLAWSLDFNCDQYCLDEIHYFQEIQTMLLYIVEQDHDSSATTAALIKNRYAFFHGFLRSELFNMTFKKTLASKLYDCFQKLKTLDLVYTQRNKTYPSKVLIASLYNLEKDLESWHYK